MYVRRLGPSTSHRPFLKGILKVFDEVLRGPGESKSGGSWKLVLWCFLTKDSENYLGYLLLFTSSKNIDPNQSYCSFVGAHV